MKIGKNECLSKAKNKSIPMPLLSSIKELINYCRYCPVCHNSERKLDVSINADGDIRIKDFQINNDFLTIDSSIKCSINLLTSEYSVSPNENIEIYFYARCPNCQSSINSYDIELPRNEKRITGTIDIEQETRYIRKNGISFSLDYDYATNWLFIGFLGAKGKDLVLPIMDFDFSNLNRLFLRLKTLVLFS